MATSKQHQTEIEALRERLREAEETLQAIRRGEVDAVVVEGSSGNQVYTLRGAEHPYRLLVEEMSEGAATLLSDGTLLYCNQRLAKMLRTPLQKLIGSSIYDFVEENGRAALGQLLQSTVQDAENEGEGEEGGGRKGRRSLELGLLAAPAGKKTTTEADRGYVPAHVSASMLEVDEVEAICLVITDLTEQKRNEEIVEAGKRKLAEEQLKANKLESIGILAGGLAHDINNSLTTILGNIALAGQAAGDKDAVVRRLAEAETACRQARDVTQQLLTFAKGGLPVRKTVSIAPLLREWTTFAMSGSNVRCDFAISSDLRPVDIDEGQISRVLSNLLINAQQAMPDGGLIMLRAENADLGPEQIGAAGLPLPPGDYVKVEIQDQGVGIPEKHLSRIFDPYFTTKEQGSGLGLAVAYSVTKSHGGHLEAESHPGVGSTFRVYLPVSEADVAVDRPAGMLTSQKGLRVLVMDDQEAIRETVGLMLAEIDSPEVDYARDGAEAIEQYRRSMKEGKLYDLVMMDLTIAGGMGGKEAVARLLEIDPHVKVIVFSGYSTDPIMAHYREYGFSGALRKPFTLDELQAEVYRVVG